MKRPRGPPAGLLGLDFNNVGRRDDGREYSGSSDIQRYISVAPHAGQMVQADYVKICGLLNDREQEIKQLRDRVATTMYVRGSEKCDTSVMSRE